MLPIDTNIPLPDLNDGKRVYPFPGMAVGDSFFVAVPQTPSETFARRRKRRQQALAERARNVGLKLKRRFSTRQVEGGVRVWRTA
ncbi:hypothetical protein [Phreatobacter sp.]|uniref:hypothetical protein n=1 Tax=Phreatobacter sp. TaxID=1966341 RepID=UPI003F711EBC